MARLDFNHEMLQVDAIDRLDSALSIVNANVDLLSSIVLPEDFKDANTFLQVREELVGSKTEIEAVLEAIRGASKDLDTLLFNCESRVSNLPESTLKRRNNTL